MFFLIATGVNTLRALCAGGCMWWLYTVMGVVYMCLLLNVMMVVSCENNQSMSLVGFLAMSSYTMAHPMLAFSVDDQQYTKIE